MENAISTIKRLPENREQLNTFVDRLTEEALSGTTDMIEIAKAIKIMDEVSSRLRANLSDAILEEMAKHGKGEHTVNGIKFAVKQRTSYEYEDDELEELKNKVKAREQFLKSLIAPVADLDTGLVIEPPIKRVSEYYIATIV
jgi:uncharacterized protein YecE (DUF72 family)